MIRILFCVTALILSCGLPLSGQEQVDSQKSSRRTAEKTDPLRPNIILINLDDADIDLFADDILDRHLPNIKKLAREGINFTNCHVVTPLCGPSRTCLLLGQHAHRTGIKTNVAAGPMNNGFSGAYDLFKQLGHEQEHVGVWMQRAGYRTMMIGKYMHGRMVPNDIPGWDDLHICFGGNYYATSRYSTRYPVDQRRRLTGKDEYRTVVEASEAVWMIEEQAKRNLESKKAETQAATQFRQPFFLYIAPLAPHKPAGQTVMLQHEYKDIGTKPGEEIRMRQTPDLNEDDVSDKPKTLQINQLPADVMESLHNEHRKRVITLKSVDDMVERIRAALEKTGEADRTYIFFTSDHGYQLGHNRMIAKKVPYHRNTVVPMFVVGPGVKQAQSNHLLAHIDLVPTFLELAGGSAPVEIDGKSWVGLLPDANAISPETFSQQFRKSLLIQNWEEKSQIGNLIPASYASLRMQNQIYTEWSNGDREFYDLTTDPYQVENAITSVSQEQQDLFSAELHALKSGVPNPIATFASPKLISKQPIIRGFAEDDQAVDRVEVSVFDKARKLYWAGTGWSESYALAPSKLLNQGGLISNWELQTADLSHVPDKGQLLVTTVAMDDEGNKSKPVKFTFLVDAIEPETLLKLPEKSTTVESPITLFGTCSDNDQMRGIELVLENTEKNLFWNGSQWGKEKSTFFKRVRGERWHVTLEVPAGNYRASAASRDRAGNLDLSPSLTEFTVK